MFLILTKNWVANVWQFFVTVLAIAGFCIKSWLEISDDTGFQIKSGLVDTMAQRWISLNVLRSCWMYFPEHFPEFEVSWIFSLSVHQWWDRQNFARGVENKGSGENLDTSPLWRSFYGRLLLNRFTLCCDQDFITHNFAPWPKKCRILLTLMVSFSSSSFLCRGK